MPKRMISCLLAILLLFSISGCAQNNALPTEDSFFDPTGYKVNGIMTYPDYTFSGNPTAQEMRQMAMKAFEDVLSVHWSISSDLIYKKTGPLSNRTFQYNADTTYAGLFYSNASTGLFQFLEYYDFETGRIRFPGTTDEFKETLGASCADAMLWGVSAVCNSISGPFYPVTMVYANGYLPVGDYTYDKNTISFNYLPTYKIIEANGKDVILDAYTKVQPGDMFTSSPANHGAMVIAAPVVVYKENGNIDLKASYITLRDQRGGGSEGGYPVEEDGQTVLYTGCTFVDFTFEKLLSKSYIPVTTAEFAGLKEYEVCEASIDVTCTSVKDLLGATVSSNYPLAVVNVIVSDAVGNSRVIDRKLFSASKRGGVPRQFALSELNCLTEFAESKYNDPNFSVSIEVVPSTGERFIVADFHLK